MAADYRALPPPAIEGVIPAAVDQPYYALWNEAGVVSRARVLAWRCSGPEAWPVTVRSIEPHAVQTPEKRIIDMITGAIYDNEDAWLAGGPPGAARDV